MKIPVKALKGLEKR